MKVYDAVATCDKIFALAKAKGWTDAKLSKILDLTPQAISKWRRGVCSPSTDMLVMLADLFEISLDDLMMQQEVNLDFNFEDWR